MCVHREIGDVERGDRPARGAGEEAEEQGDAVAIAADRVGTHAADRGQVLTEEGPQRRGQGVRGRASWRRLPRAAAGLDERPAVLREARARQGAQRARRRAGSRRWRRSRRAPCRSRAGAAWSGRRPPPGTSAGGHAPRRCGAGRESGASGPPACESSWCVRRWRKPSPRPTPGVAAQRGHAMREQGRRRGQGELPAVPRLRGSGRPRARWPATAAPGGTCGTWSRGCRSTCSSRA